MKTRHKNSLGSLLAHPSFQINDKSSSSSSQYSLAEGNTFYRLGNLTKYAGNNNSNSEVRDFRSTSESVFDKFLFKDSLTSNKTKQRQIRILSMSQNTSKIGSSPQEKESEYSQSSQEHSQKEYLSYREASKEMMSLQKQCLKKYIYSNHQISQQMKQLTVEKLRRIDKRSLPYIRKALDDSFQPKNNEPQSNEFDDFQQSESQNNASSRQIPKVNYFFGDKNLDKAVVAKQKHVGLPIGIHNPADFQEKKPQHKHLLSRQSTNLVHFKEEQLELKKPELFLKLMNKYDQLKQNNFRSLVDETNSKFGLTKNDLKLRNNPLDSKYYIQKDEEKRKQRELLQGVKRLSQEEEHASEILSRTLGQIKQRFVPVQSCPIEEKFFKALEEKHFIELSFQLDRHPELINVRNKVIVIGHNYYFYLNKRTKQFDRKFGYFIREEIQHCTLLRKIVRKKQQFY